MINLICVFHAATLRKLWRLGLLILAVSTLFILTAIDWRNSLSIVGSVSAQALSSGGESLPDISLKTSPRTRSRIGETGFISSSLSGSIPSQAPSGMDAVMLGTPITPTQRSIGTVSSYSGPTTCTDGSGQDCYTLTISCTQLSRTENATLKVGAATTSTVKGTIAFASGWIGNYFWDGDEGQKLRTLEELRGEGYQIVQIKWSRGWFVSELGQYDEGMGQLACKPATVLQWVYSNLYPQSTDTAYCAVGHSNGSTQVSLAVAQYGLSDILSAVLLESGPNFTRLDYECLQDPNHLALFGSNTVRSNIDMSFGYPSNGSGICAQQDVTELSRFEEASLAFNNWDFVYPSTMIAFVFGELDNGTTAAHGRFFHDHISHVGTPLIISSTVAGVGHWVNEDPDGAELIKDTLVTECVPRPSTYHVANTVGQCGGYIPCETGLTGLQTAIDSLLVADGTIIIHGAYEIDATNTVTIDHNVHITIQGADASASLNSSSGFCSGYMLAVNNGAWDVVMENLTLDGDDNCSDGLRSGINVISGTGNITLRNLTVRDMSTGVNITNGSTKLINDTFRNNDVAIREASSSLISIGTGPNNGNMFSDNAVAIDSNGDAIIKDNAIVSSTVGIRLSADAAAIYGNNISGTLGANSIECDGSASTGAAFNYIGGSPSGGGSNCTDSADQLGAPIVAWTEGTSLNEATSTTGPIFDLGSNAPFGYDSFVGMNSSFYAIMTGDVTISGGGTQFKMQMDGAGCDPMTSTCWESAANGRAQVGPGYFANASEDPTAITLRSVSASAGNSVLCITAFSSTLLVGLTFYGAMTRNHKRSSA